MCWQNYEIQEDEVRRVVLTKGFSDKNKSEKIPAKKCPFFWFVFFGQTKKMKNKIQII